MDNQKLTPEILEKMENHLLKECIARCVEAVDDDQEIIHARESAYKIRSMKTNEQYQVQIIVTRCNSDFLEPFQTDILEDYFKKS